MSKINCTAKIEDSELIITGFDNDIKVNVSGDIDFTHIVSILSEHIDENSEIDLTVDDKNIYDEKHKLTLEVLKDIFDKYNESVNETLETVETEIDDVVPF